MRFVWKENENIFDYDIRLAKHLGYDITNKSQEQREKNRKRIQDIIQKTKELNAKMEQEIQEIKDKYSSLIDPLHDEKSFLLRGRI